MTVAAGNQAGFLWTIRHGHNAPGRDPMDKQSFPLRKHHDLSRRDLVQAGSLDRNQITRKKGGHHAGPHDTEANSAKCADNFPRQFTRHGGGSLPLAISAHRSATNYEAFRLNLQPPWVGEILPHASAATSNTGSNRKEGAWYGFFPVTGSPVFLFEELWVFKHSS
jgi:hypothetical protein